MRIYFLMPLNFRYEIPLFKTVEGYRAECFIVHGFPQFTTNLRGLRQECCFEDEWALAWHSKPCRHQAFSLTARSASIALYDCAKMGT